MYKHTNEEKHLKDFMPNIGGEEKVLKTAVFKCASLGTGRPGLHGSGQHQS